MIYKISDIPNTDSSEFSPYIAGRRTGEWFYQNLDGENLDLGHTQGWIPIGKTYDKSILALSEVDCVIAIMYAWKNKPEDKVWFHL